MHGHEIMHHSFYTTHVSVCLFVFFFLFSFSCRLCNTGTWHGPTHRADAGHRLHVGHPFFSCLCTHAHLHADHKEPPKHNLRHGDRKQELDARRALRLGHRDARRRRRVGEHDVAQRPQQEEGVRRKHVQERQPVRPAAEREHVDGEHEERADKLVARVGHQVEHGVVPLDVEQVASQLHGGELDHDDRERTRRSVPQVFRVEASAESVDGRRRDGVRHKRHGCVGQSGAATYRVYTCRGC